MVSDLSIKPHHFVDIIRSFGRGERTFRPHPYGHAVHTVAERVLNNPGVNLKMELGSDAICLPCIHNIDGVCDDTIDTSNRPTAPTSKNEYNLLIDRRWCRRLGIAQGDRLTARQFCERMRDHMGDITDIYRETPAHRVVERSENLTGGLEYYLARSPDSRAENA